MGPLHHPAMLAQSLATLNASPGNAAGDAPLSQVHTATLVVIALDVASSTGVNSDLRLPILGGLLS